MFTCCVHLPKSTIFPFLKLVCSRDLFDIGVSSFLSVDETNHICIEDQCFDPVFHTSFPNLIYTGD